MAGVVEQVLNQGVVFGIEAADWRDLTRKVGAEMVARGLSTPEYTEAMIENVQKNGPYLVIAPGVALLHARPEAGCLENGIVIGTCAPAIEFGHSVNDPVTLFLGLSATGNMDHVAMLQGIATLLSQDGALDALKGAATKDEFEGTLRSLEADQG